MTKKSGETILPLILGKDKKIYGKLYSSRMANLVSELGKSASFLFCSFFFNETQFSFRCNAKRKEKM